MLVLSDIILPIRCLLNVADCRRQRRIRNLHYYYWGIRPLLISTSYEAG